MQTLESLNKKIKTAQDLLSVVKTMKSLAAVNIRQYERAVEALEEYKGIVDMGWQVLFRSGGVLPRSVSGNMAVCMVMGSDQGMCGQFNEAIISHAMAEVDLLKENGADIKFWGVGEKIRGALTEKGQDDGEQFSVPGSLASINDEVQHVVQKIESWRTSRNMEQFYVSHNILSGGGVYDQVFYRLLPLDREWAGHYKDQKWPARCLPMVGLPHDEMFSHLIRQYLFVSFYRAFAQSLASENAARLIAMQAAEKNISELEEKLQASFREQRQASITSELFDIMSGFEALSEEDFKV
jgi:F-type H+-transporting ATPase subunit gamma